MVIDSQMLQEAINELVEDDLLCKHLEKKGFVGMTYKGKIEVRKFIKSNLRMYLLVQQEVIEEVCKKPLNKKDFIEVKTS